MAKHLDTCRVFKVEDSPCCPGRVRITMGNKKLCLDWREADRSGRALKQIAKQLRKVRQET